MQLCVGIEIPYTGTRGAEFIVNKTLDMCFIHCLRFEHVKSSHHRFATMCRRTELYSVASVAFPEASAQNQATSTSACSIHWEGEDSMGKYFDYVRSFLSWDHLVPVTFYSDHWKGARSACI